VVKDAAFSPRLAATWDPRGDGIWTVNASFARYVTGLANNVGDSASAGGQPANIAFDYLGPNVNTGDPANPVPTAQALQTLVLVPESRRVPSRRPTPAGSLTELATQDRRQGLGALRPGGPAQRVQQRRARAGHTREPDDPDEQQPLLARALQPSPSQWASGSDGRRLSRTLRRPELAPGPGVPLPGPFFA